VRELVIAGAKAVPEAELEEKIATSEPGFFRRLLPWWPFPFPFGEDPRFDPNAFQADLRRIERYYQARGYYQAQVLSEQVLGPDGQPLDPAAPPPSSVALQVEVREGEVTLLEAVDYRGLEALSEEERAEVLDALPLVQGQPFLEEAWEESKEAIVERLKERGYAEAELDGEVQVDVETHRARATLAVEPGRRYVFGKVFVVPDPRRTVSPERIVEQARSALPEGTPYSESALAEAQARLVRMGVFGAVKVNRGLPNREAGTVPVVVDVREAPFRSVRAGGGFSNDAFRTEARLVGEYTDRNFFGGLRRLTLTARGGYALVPSLLTPVGEGVERPGDVIFNVQAELEQPRILFRDLSLQGRVLAERNILQGFVYTGGGGRVALPWNPTSSFSVVPSYNLEIYNQKAFAGVGDTAARPETSLSLGCTPRGTPPRCNVLFSYLEQLIEWDRRDDRISPRGGFYASLALQEAGGFLGGNFNSIRVAPEARYYVSVLERRALTLALRARAGTLRALGNDAEERNKLQDIPILVRFFSGGANSMRGFNGRDLAPQQLQRQQGSGTPIATPIGGRGLVEGSAELRYQLNGDIALATFLDTGTVTETALGYVTRGGCDLENDGTCTERLDLGAYLAQNPLHAAAGAGVRYLTPVGPIRLDLAYRFTSVQTPLRDLQGLPMERRTDLPYANYPVASRFTFHLSIGEAF
jgi:translocation and assembly module TamA